MESKAIVFPSLHVWLWEEKKKERKEKKIGKCRQNLTDLIPVVRRLSLVDFHKILHSVCHKARTWRRVWELTRWRKMTIPTTWAARSESDFRGRISPSCLRGLGGDSPRQRASPKRILRVRMVELEETCSADAYLELLKMYFRIKSFSRWQCDAVDTMRSVYCVWRGRMLYRI